MKYRIRRADEIEVWEMPDAGALTWAKGDFLMVNDGVPHIVPKELAAMFLEPVSAPTALAVPEITKSEPAPLATEPDSALARPPAVFVPDPVKPLNPRKAPAKMYAKPNFVKGKRTTWIIDGRPPIQNMQGLLLVRLYDATKPDFGPITAAAVRQMLAPMTWPGFAPRIRELTLAGYIETSKIDRRRYIVLSELGVRAVDMYGDEMRAFKPAEPKNAV